MAGCVVHFCSLAVIAFLKLDREEKEPQRTAASVRLERKKKKARELEARGVALPSSDSKLGLEYQDWLETDRKRKGKGLSSTTILEEEDDSDIGF